MTTTYITGSQLPDSNASGQANLAKKQTTPDNTALRIVKNAQEAVNLFTQHPELDVSEGTSYARHADANLRKQESLPTVQKDRLTIDQIYSDKDAVSLELSMALKLLAIGIEHVSESLDALRSGDGIMADDSIQHFQVLLPELFCCRPIGDGYGAIINALRCSLENRKGLPLDLRQTQAIYHALIKARSEPFLSFDKAVEEVINLENAGFITEPAEMEFLVDALTSED